MNFTIGSVKHTFHLSVVKICGQKYISKIPWFPHILANNSIPFVHFTSNFSIMLVRHV